MRHIPRAALAFVVLGAALSSGASAGDQDDAARLQKRIADLESENASLKLKCWWLGRLRRQERAPGSSGVALVQLSGPVRDQRERKLREIRLPDAPTKDDVREYVARIIIAAQDRDVYGPQDPEISMLADVGPRNVDVLIEPLVHLVGFGGSSYVVEALKELVGDRHKPSILTFLPYAQDLVEIVVARGWTRDAAPILLTRLAERSPYLSPDWIQAAATVAGPENYEDLRFQLANGQNPWSTWRAIRGLPGMEPLDGFIEREWHRTTWKRESWEWKSFAVVAAHYGHLDALGVLARHMDNDDRWVEFQKLTGYEGRKEDAASWLEQNKERLVFDGTKRAYVRSSAKEK